MPLGLRRLAKAIACAAVLAAVGKGAVATAVLLTAWGEASGEVRLRYAAVGVWADGLVVRVTNYTDVDEARAAAERLAESRA